MNSYKRPRFINRVNEKIEKEVIFFSQSPYLTYPFPSPLHKFFSNPLTTCSSEQESGTQIPTRNAPALAPMICPTLSPPIGRPPKIIPLGSGLTFFLCGLCNFFPSGGCNSSSFGAAPPNFISKYLPLQPRYSF